MVGKWIVVDNDTRLLPSVDGYLVSEDGNRIVKISSKIARDPKTGNPKIYEDGLVIKKSQILRVYDTFEECGAAVLKIKDNCDRLLDGFGDLKKGQRNFISAALTDHAEAAAPEGNKPISFDRLTIGLVGYNQDDQEIFSEAFKSISHSFVYIDGVSDGAQYGLIGSKLDEALGCNAIFVNSDSYETYPVYQFITTIKRINPEITIIATAADRAATKKNELSVFRAKGDDFLKGPLDPGVILARLEKRVAQYA